MRVIVYKLTVVMLSTLAILMPASSSDKAQIPSEPPHIAQQKELTNRVENLEKLVKRVDKLEKSLTYLLPRPIVSEADFLRFTFSQRLQSHLTGFFGAYKVISSKKISRPEPGYMLGVSLAQVATSFIPDPFVSAAINSLIEIGKFVHGKKSRSNG